MLRILFLITTALISQESLIRVEPAKFQIAGMYGTIPQHLATLKNNTKLLSQYSQYLEVYKFRQLARFPKFITKSHSGDLEAIQLPLKEAIKMKHIALTLDEYYQVVENKKNNKIYVFLGYASGTNQKVDDIVNAYVL